MPPDYPLQGLAMARLPHVRHGFFGRVHSHEHILDHFSFASSFVSLQQCHGTKIWRVTGCDENIVRRGDGLITQTRGCLLAIRTADCVPLLLAGDDHVAAIHVGWRGAFAGIIQEACAQLTKSGARLSQCHALLGPSIMAHSYEVGGEFEELLRQSGHHPPNMFLTPHPKKQGKFFFDLRHYVMTTLRASGIHCLEEIPLDSYDEPSLCSYRRFCHGGKQEAQEAHEAQWSVIALA